MSEMDPDIPINLGQKRKLYNECVQYGISTDTPIVSEYIQGEDIEKLMNIDIACAKQDVKFVLNALTDEDMLYVSRTIKQSTWVITDKKYATIINPEYLQTQLLPKMSTKAVNKLMHHIRLHLKDESRVEEFYKSEKNIQKALKWLPTCSVPFIEQEIAKHAQKIEIKLLKRLSERSTSIWTDLMKRKDLEVSRKTALKSTFYVLFQNTDAYLDIVEEIHWYDAPELGVRGTHMIMKSNYRRVLDNLKIYLNIIDIPTFVKCLNKTEVKDVLYKIAEVCSDNTSSRYYNKYNMFDISRIQCFIKQMPIDQQYKFVKDVFIEKIHTNRVDADTTENLEINKMAKLYTLCQSCISNDYVLYQLAPFEEAFTLIKDCIRKETRQYERNSMLKAIVDCAGSNTKYIKEVIQYFIDKHINDKLISKEDFLFTIISKKPIYKHDENTWALMHEIIKSIDVYKESEDVSQSIIEAIIVYNILNNKNVPKIIEKKFIFNSLKEYGNQMNQSDKDKLFNYLFNLSVAKVNNCEPDNEDKFKNKVDLLSDVLSTLDSWKKDLVNYPIILEKIRECVQLKKKNGWKTDLSNLYNRNKSWKKYMFEDSINLNPSEEVCLNALKHDSGLLKRNEDELRKLARDDKVSLRRLLSKMKIFWYDTLAKEWSEECIMRLKENDGSVALVQGMCAILKHNQLLDIIKAYAPEQSEIDWEKADSFKIVFQRNIAKIMHTARPQPPPDSILLYAKGDYLQYALPSVLAIFYNLSLVKTREFIPKLFDTPVSLQKHGLRIAVSKIPQQEVINIFKNIWQTSKNLSIRSVIFKLTFTLLTEEKDNDKVNEIWSFLSTIIDGLSFEEDSTVYEYFGLAEDVPILVRAQYLERSYIFLQRMLPSTSDDDRKKIESFLKIILEIAERIMDHMCPIFVTKVLLEYIEELNVNPVEQILHKNVKINLLSTFLLVNSTEETQDEKFNSLCVPFIKCSLKTGHKTLVPRLQFFLRQSVMKVLQSQTVVPDKIFSRLHDESSTILEVSENYVLLTEMKLFAALLKVLKNMEKDDLKNMLLKNNAMCEFGKVCVAYLQEDIETHFPLIYNLFAKALNNVYSSFQFIDDEKKSIRNVLCSSILQNKDFIPAYLVALKIYMLSIYNAISTHQESENKALLNLILENKSVEVRMHYNSYIRVP